MPLPAALSRRGGAAALALGLFACAGRLDGAGAGAAAAFIDRPLAGPDVATEGAALSAVGPRSPAAARLVRLDRLLDLFDAARFARAPDARAALWEALGGSTRSTGPDASREALHRLLQEAWAVEDARGLGEDHRRLLADLIMLLSVDLNWPVDAESLSIQTSAYRTLAATGHPRVADNARWRLYDHLRGVLAGATAAPAEQRMQVAVHALYAVREDVEPWLSDAAPHGRPPPPAPDELWALLSDQTDRLAEIPRWRPVVETRRPGDEELRETVLAVLPVPRDGAWPLPEVARGTGVPESLGPVLSLVPGQAVVEPGRATSRPRSAVDPELSPAIEQALARDGRGVLLLASDPMLPSPELAAALRAAIAARTSVLELAVREPRTDDENARVVVALPLHVSAPDDPAPGARAFADARLRLHLDGRGPRVAVDGAWLAEAPSTPAQLSDLLARLGRAYPRETAVALTMSDNVLAGQLVDLVGALVGGPRRAFAAVGLLPGRRDRPPPGGDADGRVAARARLYADPPPPPRLDQPFRLKDEDQRRLEGLALELARCLPELESPVSREVELTLRFAEGRLSEAAVGKAAPRRRRALLLACVGEVAVTFRLREHRDLLTVTLGLSPPP